MAMALLTGLLTGAMAYVLKHLIGMVSARLMCLMSPHTFNPAFLLFPIVGIVLTGMYQRYVLHTEIYHGVERLGLAVAHRRYKLPAFLMYAPVVASTLTLGFGGSAGSEGPIAYTGAAIGSNVARRFGVRPELMRYMLACGASAGITGIFMAPIGGALFSLEVLSVELSVVAVAAVFVASLASWMMAFILAGYVPDLPFLHYQHFGEQSWPFVLALGVFCGVYSLYYSRIMRRMVKFYNHLTNPWYKNLLSGAIVAGCVFLFPALWGEGYGFIAKVLATHGADITNYSLFASASPSDHRLLILIAGGMLILKPFATASTNSGGGVAGDFAPTLFAGCIAGYFFALAGNMLFGLNLSPANYAFLGMAGVMAGAIQAPLMAIFIVVEMVSHYALLLPVMATATISFAMMKVAGKVINLHWFFRNRASN